MWLIEQFNRFYSVKQRYLLAALAGSLPVIILIAKFGEVLWLRRLFPFVLLLTIIVGLWPIAKALSLHVWLVYFSAAILFYGFGSLFQLDLESKPVYFIVFSTVTWIAIFYFFVWRQIPTKYKKKSKKTAK